MRQITFLHRSALIGKYISLLTFITCFVLIITRQIWMGYHLLFITGIVPLYLFITRCIISRRLSSRQVILYLTYPLFCVGGLVICGLFWGISQSADEVFVIISGGIWHLLYSFYLSADIQELKNIIDRRKLIHFQGH